MRGVFLAGSASLALATAASAAPCSFDLSVSKVVAEEYGKSPASVSPQDKFAVDGPHTIEDVEIKQMVEDKFHMKIADDAWAKLVSIQDIATYLQERHAVCR